MTTAPVSTVCGSLAADSQAVAARRDLLELLNSTPSRPWLSWPSPSPAHTTLKTRHTHARSYLTAYSQTSTPST